MAIQPIFPAFAGNWTRKRVGAVFTGQVDDPAAARPVRILMGDARARSRMGEIIGCGRRTLKSPCPTKSIGLPPSIRKNHSHYVVEFHEYSQLGPRASRCVAGNDPWFSCLHAWSRKKLLLLLVVPLRASRASGVRVTIVHQCQEGPT